MRLGQQEQFKSVDNQLFGEVKDPIHILNQNQHRHQMVVGDRKDQMGELIEHTKKLIAQYGEPSRDLGNQQSVFSHQFVQMKQRQANVEKELLATISYRRNPISHANVKQSENQVIKEELQATKVQNRNRATHHFVHGDQKMHLVGMQT